MLELIYCRHHNLDNTTHLKQNRPVSEYKDLSEIASDFLINMTKHCFSDIVKKSANWVSMLAILVYNISLYLAIFLV